MNIKLNNLSQKRLSLLGFSLEEVVFSMGISAMLIAGMITGQTFAYKQTLWTAASSAAQNLAMQRIEQTRCAKWDSQSVSGLDQLTTNNFPVQVVSLPLPLASTNVFMATNTTSITTISANPPVRLVRVDVSWSVDGKRSFTNTMFTYRSSDQ